MNQRAYDYAFFVCANGLGHLRRSIAVGAKLAGSVVIFADPDRLDRLRPRIDPLPTNITFIDWPAGSPRIPLVDAGVVVSDNLPDVLDVYPDTILQGSFFWHDSVQCGPRYIDYCNTLLFSKPRMIGVGEFASSSVRTRTRFMPVGLYSYNSYPRQTIPSERRSILISCGHGAPPELVDQYRAFVRDIWKSSPPPHFSFHVQPNLLHPTGQQPIWLRPADYSTSMYASLRAAIIRPGLGTICDVLNANVPIFPMYEPNNLEMSHNAAVIQERGYGVDCGDFDETYHYARHHTMSMSVSPMTGLDDTVRILESAK